MGKKQLLVYSKSKNARRMIAIRSHLPVWDFFLTL